MHMIFSEEEKAWVNMRSFGWPIKDGCPNEIKGKIEKKKRTIEEHGKMMRDSKKEGQ